MKLDNKEQSYTVFYQPIKGGYQVSVPLFPEIISFGRTLDEAQEMANDAIKCYLEAMKKSKQKVPSEQFILQGRVLVTC